MEKTMTHPAFPHQAAEFQTHRNTPVWALFWEQGTGKSRAIIDLAGYLFVTGKIDAVLVVAPNGVHRNWVTDEIPAHTPEEIADHVRAFAYSSGKASTKTHANSLRALLAHQGLAWLTISYDAFTTANAKKATLAFFNKRRVLYVLDEAHYIKNPTADRTRSILRSSRFAVYRRLLTGTPIAQGPFDTYSQIKFLDDGFWQSRGLPTYTEFKQHFGVWKKGWNPAAFNRETKANTGAEYDVLVGYRRLDQLQEMLKGIATRVTKDQALSLPPKLYSRRTFPLSPEQAKLYAQIRDDFIAWLDSGPAPEVVVSPEPNGCASCGGTGELEVEGFIYPCPDCSAPADAAPGGRAVIAALAITRLLRLQQITSGYLPVEAGEPEYLIPGPNRRLSLLGDLVEEAAHQVIVWARFQKDITMILEELKARGITAVRYDGLVSDDEREAGKTAFKKGEAKAFVANPAAGATGLTLTEAKTVIYYTNSFKLIDRLQSEDRAHRIGQTNEVLYIDLVAEDTVDDKIVEALRNKKNIASQITGDELREWL
jgi:SNF2 family DNA or RNA helicase